VTLIAGTADATRTAVRLCATQTSAAAYATAADSRCANQAAAIAPGVVVVPSKASAATTAARGDNNAIF
jgi:hypothetical protein